MDQFWSHLGPFGPSWACLGTHFGPVWGYLELLEAILGASWGQELPRHLSDSCACAPVAPSWPILALILGPFFVFCWLLLGSFFGSLSVHFLDHCCANFGSQNRTQNRPISRGPPTGKSGRRFPKSCWSQDAPEMASSSSR